MPAADSAILDVFDQAWARLTGRLQGLEDGEHLWEPVPGCWTIRPAPDGSWTVDGEAGDLSRGQTPPDPAPFTTIAWRLFHISVTFRSFGDRFFTGRAVTLADLPVPATAREALDSLTRHYQDHWRAPLETMPPERWTDPIGPLFGPYAHSSGALLALHVLDEFVHHSAEVGVLRDLYRHREHLAGG